MVPERILLRILRRVTVKGLLRLMETSKSLFVFARYPKIWKRIAIKRWDGEFRWKGSWKLTALLPLNQDMSNAPPTPTLDQAFIEARFPLLASRTRRALVDLEKFRHAGADGNVERVDFRSISTEEWIERFDRGNKPCIITHGMDDWPAYAGGAWTKEALLEKYEGNRFLTDEVDSRGDKMKMSLANYFTYMENCSHTEDDPIYLFDPKFVKHSDNKLRDDFKILPFFKEDFFSLLSKKERPFYQWLIFGCARSGSCFHTDPYQTSACTESLFSVDVKFGFLI
jgi:hypothetical protein